MSTTLLKDHRARVAEDAERHGYNGRDGDGAVMLKECARAVRIAARNLEHRHNVPSISADERADYAAELAARLVGENSGQIPTGDKLARKYLIKRVQGIILNDRQRYGLDITDPADDESTYKADPRLDGPLSVPDHVQRAAESLPISEAARRALIAAVVPATRQEWADFFGYSSAESWHTMAKRGRRELYAIGEGPLRAALLDAERDAGELIDEIEADLRDYLAR